MFGECHAHLIMDGLNYRRAVDLHADGVKDKVIQPISAVSGTGDSVCP